jgi:hypothetical protein
MGGGATVRVGVPARGPYAAREERALLELGEAWDAWRVNIYRLTGLSPADAGQLTMGEINAWLESIAERR